MQQAVKDTKTEVKAQTADVVRVARNVMNIPAQNIKQTVKTLSAVGQFGALGKGLVEQYTKPSEK